MPLQRPIMLPPDLGPFGEIVLRGRGAHVALEADDLAPEPGLFLDGFGGGEAGVEEP